MRTTKSPAAPAPTEAQAAAGTAWHPPPGARARPREYRALRVRTSVAVLAALALAVLFVPLLFPLDQQAVDLAAKLRPPSAGHPLGTDDLGRDLLLRCVYGLRVSLLVGCVAALVASLLGVCVGALAASAGGRTDRLVMRAVDAVSAVPHLLLGVFIVAMFRPGVWPVIVSVGLTHWISTARIVRAEIHSHRSRPYIDAAVSGGATRWRVTVRHLVAAVAAQAALAAVLMVPHAIWHESALSFLGLGIPSHEASLGTMTDEARGSLLAGHWWPTLFPGLFIIVPTLALAAVAAAWRERINPRRRSELML